MFSSSIPLWPVPHNLQDNNLLIQIRNLLLDGAVLQIIRHEQIKNNEVSKETHEGEGGEADMVLWNLIPDVEAGENVFTVKNEHGYASSNG